MRTTRVRTRRLRSCLVASVAALTACDRGERPVTLSDAESRAIDQWLGDRVRDQRIPGLAAAVILDGAVVKRFTVGVEDLASGAPVTPQTSFQLASTSKSLSSTGVMTLVADGRSHSRTHGAITRIQKVRSVRLR
ncbi:MAG: beta-lactamase family protein [Gemmatimonadetes bacterium]|nr:beta-lactamase family protein [Gemmatimonadota bacterium]